MIHLVLRAQKNDTEAFIQLIKSQEQMLYKIARGYFQDGQDIDDVMQDTVLACFEKLGTLKKPQYFKTWLVRILINKCNDQLKHKKNLVSLDAVVDHPSPDPSQDTLEFLSVLDALDEKYRMILLLYYSEGFKVKEISKLTDLSTDAVKTRLKRGRQQLKTFYEQQREEAFI